MYRPGDPGKVVENAEAIQRALFPEVRERRLQVHPASGSLWLDTGRRGGGAEPPLAVRAREVSASFLADARRRLASIDGLRGLVPDDLRPLDTWSGDVGEEGRGGSTVCRFVRLMRPGSADDPVPVFGETVEVWVDAAGAVQAFGSTCRLPGTDTTVARLPSPDDDEPPEAGHDHEEKMSLIYLGGDEDQECDAVCPFWIRWAGEMAVISPASAYSMVVRIVPTRFSGGIALEALTTGGSGRFDYLWQAWSPMAPTEIVPLSSGASARVGAGVWDIAVRVRDTVSGIAEKAVLRVVGTDG